MGQLDKLRPIVNRPNAALALDSGGWIAGAGRIAMTCDHVVATLRDHEPELRAAGVVRLFVFGSTARGDGRPDSDIDLLAGSRVCNAV